MKPILSVVLLVLMVISSVFAAPWRFDNTADDLDVAANLPNEISTSWTMWFNMESGAGTQMSFVYLIDGTAVAITRYDKTTADLLRAGSNASQTTGTTVINTGTWYGIAGTKNATTTHRIYVLINGVLTQEASNVSTETAAAAAQLMLGNSSDTGTLACLCIIGPVKFWNATLSVSQLENELKHIRPLVTDQLYAWWPNVSNSTITAEMSDYSGGAHTLNNSGVVYSATMPPIGW